MSKLKRIKQRLDFLISKVDFLTEILVTKFDINIEAELSKARKPDDLRTDRERAQQEADDHYWDPTKHPKPEEIRFPLTEDTDIVISEVNKHFE